MLGFQNTVMTVIFVVIAVGILVALVDAATRKAPAFEAAGKLTKSGWLLILAVALGAAIFLPMFGLFIGAVVMLVYFLDVRPAVSALSKGR